MYVEKYLKKTKTIETSR